MSASGLLEDLIESLRCLPGVGPKSAQRIALHLLKRDRNAARKLGETLIAAMDRVNHCQQCRLFTEETLCRWCSDPARQSTQLCIVENPADVLAIDHIASRCQIPVLQIARGIPVGSELEFADGGTLSVAFSQRTPVG